ncbi:alginate export family protein [Sphingomonas hylomeconis]|uniref:Alginate export family protein n=1 Tax=Sphingomonas hylomeconis TaxID=1395958 RepID=A0ABV7SWG9_9SPHN|nr:alginate export family protein [Sphingomonas hylomeconis]
MHHLYPRRARYVIGGALWLAASGTASAQDAPATVTTQNAPLPIDALPAETKAVPSGTTPASPYPSEAAGRGPKIGPLFYLIRHAEDWRFLASPKAKRDRFSALKYIPLSEDGDTFLTLSGDQRSRFNFSSRPGLNDATDRHEFMLRTAVGADLHIGPALRLYGQIQSAQIFGRNESPHIAIQQNDLIVQELFAEVQVPVADGKARIMLGRQEFFDGPRFIISPRENPNIRVSMNGARVSMDWDRFRFTAVHFTPTEQGIGTFDDGTANGERLTGINASAVVTDQPIGGLKSTVFFDPFFFHFEGSARTLARLSGSERRETYGARLWGHVGRVDFDWTGMKQDGRFGTRRVNAWAASSNQSIALSSGPRAARIGFHADYASGGGNYDTSGTVNSFNFLYNATIMFSDDNYVGAINLMGIAPTASVQATKKLRLGAEAGFYWRPNERDAVYRGNSQPYVGTQSVDGKQVATIYRGNAAWAIDPHVTIVGQVNYVEAGHVLRSAGYRDNLFFSTIMNFKS